MKQNNLKNLIKKIIKEIFNLDQFSSNSNSSDDDNDPVLRAINNALKDPEGKAAIVSHQKQKNLSIDNVLQTFSKQLLALKKIDITKIHKIGSGAGGIAFELENNNVLKITHDADEARTSNLLKNKKIPGIIFIKDVWQFPNQNLYGIIMEKIIPFKQWPNDTMKNSIEEIVDSFNIKDLLQKHGSDSNKIWKEISTSPLFKLAGNPEDLQRAFLLIFEILNTLKKVGISSFFDLHLDNLGKRNNGEIVLFDLGFSEGGTEPPLLSEKRKIFEFIFKS